MSDQPTEPVEPDNYEEPTPVDPDPPTDIEYDEAVNNMTAYLAEFLGVNALHQANDSPEPFAVTVEDATPGLGEIVFTINDRLRLTLEVYRTQS